MWTKVTAEIFPSIRGLKMLQREHFSHRTYKKCCCTLWLEDFKTAVTTYSYTSPATGHYREQRMSFVRAESLVEWETAVATRMPCHWDT